MSKEFKAIPYTSKPASLSALGLGVAAVLMAASPMATAQTAPAPAPSGSPVSLVDGKCDPEVARQMAQRYQQQQDDMAKTMNPLFKTIKDVAEDSMADLSACTEMAWPTMKISYPTMDQIIRGVAQTAVRKACGVARDVIAKKDSYLSNSFYLNTRIPGVPSYGISTSGSGSGGITWGTPSGGGTFGGGMGGGTSPTPVATPPLAPPSGFPGGSLFTPSPAPPPTSPTPPTP